MDFLQTSQLKRFALQNHVRRCETDLIASCRYMYLQFVTKLLGSRYFSLKWQAAQWKISLVNRKNMQIIFCEYIHNTSAPCATTRKCKIENDLVIDTEYEITVFWEPKQRNFNALQNFVCGLKNSTNQKWEWDLEPDPTTNKLTIKLSVEIFRCHAGGLSN